MTISANERLEMEGVGASNAEVATQQGQASQQDGNDAQSRSAHILPTPADSDELRTQGLSVIAAARESVADAAGNALRVGDRSKHLQAALEPLRSEIYHAMLSDLGLSENGPQRPTETQRMTVRNLASLDVLAETFWTWIAERGVLTSKGKTRSAVNTLLSIIDRQTKLATTIGLERKARDVSRMSIDEYLQATKGQR